MVVSDAPNCGVTYDHHYDNRNSFIIQATGIMMADDPVPIFDLLEQYILGIVT